MKTGGINPAGFFFYFGLVDHDGKALWALGIGHPDTCYVGKIDPERPGFQIFYGIEPGRKSNTVCLVEGKTGRQLWGNPEITVHVHGQAMVGDINPAEPGMECYAGEAKGGSNFWLYTASGKLLGKESLGELSPHGVYWLDGPTKVIRVGKTLYRWPREKVGELEGRVVAIADCIGDWREEIVTALDGEIRVYSTTVPASTRRVCPMQDRLYRTDVQVHGHRPLRLEWDSNPFASLLYL